MLDAVKIAPEIEAERMTLRPPRAGDAGLISLYLGDPRVARMLTAVPHPYPPGAAEALIERARTGRRGGPLYVMDATKSEGPELIGLVFLNAQGEDATGRPVFSLGYMVGPPFWNTGYATEAVSAAVDHLFSAGAGALTACVFTDNEVSARLLTGLGFDYRGEDVEHCAARGGVAPVWRYRLEREAWASRS